MEIRCSVSSEILCLNYPFGCTSLSLFPQIQFELQKSNKVFLFLFSDKALASSYHHCGGNVSLDQKPSGHINLTLAGLFTNSSSLDPMILQSNKTSQVSVCTWVIDIPLGGQVLLKLVWLENGSSISVRCVWKEEDRALVSGGKALLSGCDKNKAALTWTGAGRSLNAVQLAYYGEKTFLQ